MIYIQRVRSNDIGEDYGKQVELGKVFMSNHKWETGEIPVILTFRALSESQMSLNGTKIKTSFKVRGDERGGDRIGVDCKEYANQDRICVLKQFLTEKLHLTPGQDYFILEDVGNDGRSFNLYGVHSTEIPATVLLDKFKGQVVDMDEPQETVIIKIISLSSKSSMVHQAPANLIPSNKCVRNMRITVRRSTQTRITLHLSGRISQSQSRPMYAIWQGTLFMKMGKPSKKAVSFTDM